MSIEAAYSLELKQVISALEANQYRRQGKLHDRKAFLCVGSGDCKAQLTCTNFSKLPNEWGVPPYFKKPPELNPHSSNCDYVQDKATAKKRKKFNGSSFKKTGNFNLLLDTNGFNKPKSDNPSITGKSNSTTITRYTSKSVSIKRNTQQKNSKIKSLRKLVDVYQSEDYDNSTTQVNMDASSVTLKELFYNLDTASEIQNQQHVYFGKAIIYEIKAEDKFYIIKFLTKHSHKSNNQSVTVEPSILVFKDQIQKHKHLKKFVKYVNTKDTFTCYFFGSPKLQKFINFELQNNYHNLFLRD